MASSPNGGISGDIWDERWNRLGQGATTAADWLGGVVAPEELTPGGGDASSGPRVGSRRTTSSGLRRQRAAGSGHRVTLSSSMDTQQVWTDWGRGRNAERGAKPVVARQILSLSGMVVEERMCEASESHVGWVCKSGSRLVAAWCFCLLTHRRDWRLSAQRDHRQRVVLAAELRQQFGGVDAFSRKDLVCSGALLAARAQIPAPRLEGPARASQTGNCVGPCTVSKLSHCHCLFLFTSPFRLKSASVFVCCGFCDCFWLLSCGWPNVRKHVGNWPYRSVGLDRAAALQQIRCSGNAASSSPDPQRWVCGERGTVENAERSNPGKDPHHRQQAQGRASAEGKRSLGHREKCQLDSHFHFSCCDILFGSVLRLYWTQHSCHTFGPVRTVEGLRDGYYVAT